jgi:ABC-2 type transport system ATP-binding protein
VLDTNAAAGTLSLRTDGSAPDVRALLNELDPDGTAVAEFAIQKATLDDVFLTLTGQTTREEAPDV